MNKDNYYEILDVQPDATPEEIQKAYRRLALTQHPDIKKTLDSEEKMKEINGAYEVLSDPEKRRQFDEERVIAEPPPVRPDRSGQHTRSPWHEPPLDPEPTRRQRERDKGSRREPSPDHTPRRQPRRQREEPPQYEPPPDPEPPRRQQRPQQSQWMAYATRLVVFLLILVVMWLGTPQIHADGQLQPASPLVSPAVQATPQPATTEKTFEAWKSEGDTFMEQQRNGDALAAYDNALKIRPDASELWVIEGDIYSIMGNFEKSITCYDRALETNPQAGNLVQKKIWTIINADALMQHADLLIGQENYPAAIDIYDGILSAGIRNMGFQNRVLSAKVYALMKSGRPDEAACVSRSIVTG